MNKGKIRIYKTLVIGILFLFIGTGTIPSFALENNNENEKTLLTFYTFDRTKTRECKAELSKDTAEEISVLFEEIKEKIMNNPSSGETQELKNDFVEILDENGLISKDISKDYIISLLKPRWNVNTIKKVLPGPFSNSGSAFICSVAGSGYGLIFLPLMLPRPRFTTIWTSVIDAKSMAANLLTGWGFVATGNQLGMALGFLGVGLSFAFPGEPASFGFVGYALAAFVKADNIETYPLN